MSNLPAPCSQPTALLPGFWKALISANSSAHAASSAMRYLPSHFFTNVASAAFCLDQTAKHVCVWPEDEAPLCQPPERMRRRRIGCIQTSRVLRNLICGIRGRKHYKIMKRSNAAMHGKTHPTVENTLLGCGRMKPRNPGVSPRDAHGLCFAAEGDEGGRSRGRGLEHGQSRF